jgi:hypothetical protein
MHANGGVDRRRPAQLGNTHLTLNSLAFRPLVEQSAPGQVYVWY